jgi:hypothetical protein
LEEQPCWLPDERDEDGDSVPVEDIILSSTTSSSSESSEISIAAEDGDYKDIVLLLKDGSKDFDSMPITIISQDSISQVTFEVSDPWKDRKLLSTSRTLRSRTVAIRSTLDKVSRKGQYFIGSVPHAG